MAIAHGMEKLKTIGDSYMCVGGLPETNRTHPIDACLMGLAMQAFVEQMKRQRDKFRLPSLELRVGVHTGSVMSGIVGKRKFTYDIWGDAVAMFFVDRIKPEFSADAEGRVPDERFQSRRSGVAAASSQWPTTPRRHRELNGRVAGRRRHGMAIAGGRRGRPFGGNWLDTLGDAHSMTMA